MSPAETPAETPAESPDQSQAPNPAESPAVNPGSLGIGDEVEAEVTAIAHGGHAVARVDGQVVFVRHALPGERVRVRVTEVDRTFARGDAVEVLVASPDRVEPPCPLSRPGGCGGCDFQHVALPAQRRLKAAVVEEQLRRLARIDREVEVEPVPGDSPEVERGLRWRTRMQYVGLPDGRRGLRRHRSHEVVPVEDCLIAHPRARAVISAGPAGPEGSPGSNPGSNPETVVEHVETAYGARDLRVATDGFWQVHPGAPRVLVETVLGMLAPRPGERALDLYSGVGLFSVFLAEAVGEGGRLLSVEGDRRATELARENLAAYPWAEAVPGRVDRVLHRRGRSDPGFDTVVLDPPRTGAKRAVVEAVAARRPRAVAYVACDPAALARDLAYFAGRGYELRDLRAFDLFPMTHHVECVALLEPR